MIKRKLAWVLFGLAFLGLCCALWYYRATTRNTPAGNARFVQTAPEKRI